MKTKRLNGHLAGFTLVELSIYMVVGIVVGAVSLSFLLSGVTLSTKNLNLNRSHDDLRLAFDRLAHHLSGANNVPTMLSIDSSGNAVTANPPETSISTPMLGTLTGPTAGIKFDSVIGSPYVLESPQTANNPLAAGTVSATATSLNIFYAKNGLTHVPHLATTAAASNVSSQGMVLLIPLANGSNLRARIASVGTRDSSNTTWHKQTLTFASQLGQGFTWSANQPQTAKVVRSEAFLVVRVDAGTSKERCELRYYKSFEPTPLLSDKTKYVVLSDQIGIKTGEDTPFSIVNYNGDQFVQSTLRVRERSNTQWVGTDVNESFYTYFQLHVNLPSRFRPRTTN